MVSLRGLPLSFHNVANGVSRLLSAVLGYLLVLFGYLKRPPPPPQPGKEYWIVITGCSTGLGKDMALHLASPKGGDFVVYAGVRKKADGEQLVKEFTSRGLNGRGRIVPLIIDVSSESSVAAAVKTVAKALEANQEHVVFHGIIANAGIGVVGPMEIVPTKEILQTVDINLLGVTRTVSGFTPLMRKHGVWIPNNATSAGGRIIVISSMYGRFAPPLEGPYTMTKFALQGYVDTLRLEMGSQFYVGIVEPGCVQSQIWFKRPPPEDVSAMLASHPSGELYRNILADYFSSWDEAYNLAIPPSFVSEAIHHSMTSWWPMYRYTIGWDAWEWCGLKAWLPDRVWDAYSKSVFGYGALP